MALRTLRPAARPSLWRTARLALAWLTACTIIGVIDFDQELVGFDQVAFIHIDLGDVAVDPGEDVDQLVGDEIGGIGKSNVEVLFHRRSWCRR